MSTIETDRTWFLSNRITATFALTTAVLSVTLGIAFVWIVRATILEEIEALALEEVAETQAYFKGEPPTPEEFALIAGDLQQHHPDTPIAWRIRSQDGDPWSEFGAPQLLRRLPAVWPRDPAVRSPDARTRLALAPLEGGFESLVALDCSTQVATFRRIVWAALGFVVVATGVATAAGRFVGLRVSSLMAQVAACARTEAAPERWLSPGRAPEEIRALVTALQDTLRRIRDESEKARLLTSGMAHELRSPLQNLMGETQVALLREREAVEYRRVLESQLEDLGELSRVVDNLVTLSSVEEARRRPTVEHFDLANEADLRLARERQLARRRGVGLEVVADGALQIEGDRESLLLALRNVVTNAIEWSPPGERVDVHMQKRGDELEIVVDDAGPGVPPVEREAIFRPFHRGPAAAGRRVGFGLGLALTHSAIDAQGGTIEVGDSPAGGARIRISLPARGTRGADARVAGSATAP